MSNNLNISGIQQLGWEFVNLFFDRRTQVFFCRIRRVEPEKNQNDWLEMTTSGATMQIAFDNAVDALATSP